MKEIIYNDNNLTEKEITNYTRRAKIILIDDNNNIILCHSDNNIFLPGGRMEQDEDDLTGLTREIKEELGINIILPKLKPFLTIKWYSKDYPEINQNTKTTNTYYSFKCNQKPNNDNLNLTEEEIKENFHTIIVNKQEVLDILTKQLKVCSKEGTVKDTIEAIKVYLKEEQKS